MKAFFVWMAGGWGRLLRGTLGIILIIWGYTLRASTAGIVLMIIGALIALVAAFNLCTLAPLFGYPFSGRKLLASSPPEGSGAAQGHRQGRPLHNAGSTTGGGSDFGQGSTQLGRESYKQGSKQNEGSNYKNEPGVRSGEDAIE